MNEKKVFSAFLCMHKETLAKKSTYFLYANAKESKIKKETLRNR